MAVHDVDLTNEAEEIVAQLMATGRFKSVAEIIRLAVLEGLRDLAEISPSIEEILARIMVGYEQVERGEFVEGSTDEVFDRVLARAELRWDAQRS